jgi:hypothetical protein
MSLPRGTASIATQSPAGFARCTRRRPANARTRFPASSAIYRGVRLSRFRANHVLGGDPMTIPFASRKRVKSIPCRHFWFFRWKRKSGYPTAGAQAVIPGGGPAYRALRSKGWPALNVIRGWRITTLPDPAPRQTDQASRSKPVSILAVVRFPTDPGRRRPGKGGRCRGKIIV